MTRSTSDDLRAAATSGGLANRPAPHLGESGAALPITPLSLGEADRSALRPVVAELERQLLQLNAQSGIQGYAEVSAQLALSWRRLVTLIALGEPPELRACPHCGYQINRAATRCIQCWKQSPGGGRAA